MSVVLSNAKNLYKKALIVEFFCLVFLVIIFYVFYRTQMVSCLLGALTAFLPQVAFSCYFLFFQSQVTQNKAKLLYKSEGLKIGLTVGLFVLVFLLFDVQPLGLFIGYFLTIALNNVIPILFTLSTKSTN